MTMLVVLSTAPPQVVDPVAAAQPAARSKDLMRAMKEAAQGMRGGREVRTRPSKPALAADTAVVYSGQPSDMQPPPYAASQVCVAQLDQMSFSSDLAEPVTQADTAGMLLSCTGGLCLSLSVSAVVYVSLQVPLEELDLRRLRDSAEEMREQLSLTSRAVS